MIEQLKLVAGFSDDPDTQTACIITATPSGGYPKGAQVSSANELPTGVAPLSTRLARPDKYVFVMHAERRAIAQAARDGIPLRGGTMYLYWFPCAICAGSIVEAGIRLIICDRQRYEERKADPRYEFVASIQILAEGGVSVGWLDEGNLTEVAKLAD